MAETQIEWTDATSDPVAGCSVISAGCTNCYAMETARTSPGDGHRKIQWPDAPQWQAGHMERELFAKTELRLEFLCIGKSQRKYSSTQ